MGEPSTGAIPMGSDRARRQETEYRLSLSAGILVSVAVHLLLLAVGSFLLLPLHVRAEQPPLLGYRGPKRTLLELEILEPNSIQSYFYQRRREGRRSTPEYHVLQKLDLEAGPHPILVRQDPERQRRPEKPRATVDDAWLRDPTLPFHAQLSFSEDFVILKMVKPDYPEYERSRAIEGFVLVAFYVTPEGDIQVPQVLEAGTSPVGASTAAFEAATLDAVKQWKVLPPRRDGQPRGFWHYIRWNFDLSDVEP